MIAVQRYEQTEPRGRRVAKRISLDDPDLDQFTRFVLGHIDEDVRRSLTDEQFESIRQAVDATKPKAKHPLDFRGVIPLFFARYYFVILGGRDQRTDQSNKEFTRRRNASSTFTGLMLLIVLLIPITAILILGGYLMKSFLGIDVFPDAHFMDYLR